MDISQEDGLTLRLTTPRLVLRSMTAADAPAFHALVTQPQVARMLFLFHEAWPLAEAAPFLHAWRWQGRLGFRLAIERDGAWIGWIGADDAAEPEIFYALEAGHAGCGLMQEAVMAFCGFLFDRFDMPALRAGVFTDNPASARLLARCGFVLMGEELHPSRARLAPAPSWVYRLTRADLRKTNGKPES